MTKTLVPVSPFSTGAGGAHFENSVAATYLVSLLRRECGRGPRGIVRIVKLQQRNLSFPVDDVIVVSDDGSHWRNLALQVKSALRFTENDEFCQVMQACWDYFCQDNFNKDLDRIGIAIGEKCNTLTVKNYLQNLLELARTSSDSVAFYGKAQAFVSTREYLELFETVLNAAAGESLPPETILAFLKRFLVIPFDFDPPGSRDLQSSLDGILNLLQDRNPQEAETLWRILRDLAAEYKQAGGEIDARVLREKLPAAIRLINVDQSRSIQDYLLSHLNRQIAREKNSKKYIPDVFAEVTSIKDRARCFSHPVLFLSRIVEAIQRLNLSPLNHVLSMLSLAPLHLDIPEGLEQVNSLDDMDSYASSLIAILQNARDTLVSYKELNGKSYPLTLVAEKQYLYDKVWHHLQTMGFSLLWQLEDCINDLSMVRSRVLFLVGRAGQGKTNFVCDFADNVLRKRSLPGFFFTGHELSMVSPEKVGDYIVYSVFGDRYHGDLDMMLRDLDQLSHMVQAPVTVIIDGLNEHQDIAGFSFHLEKFIERLLEYGAIRFILTCRSEYFEQRFANFECASFADKIRFVRDLEHRMTSLHKKHMIDAYFGFFNLLCPNLSSVGRETLGNDTLLLRVFCEAYGDHTASGVTPLPQMADVYTDEVFRLYLSKKLKNVSQRLSDVSGLSVAVDVAYRQVLAFIVRLMIDRNQFENIPVTDLPTEYHQALGDMIGEDIIVRKDLVEGRSVLDDKTEVVNFTFDEFRDFLLTDHLVAVTFGESLEEFRSLVERLTLSQTPTAEGVRKFLFFASKRPEGQHIQGFIMRCPWYEETFINHIFSVQEQLITTGDLETISSRFLEDSWSAERIIGALIRRSRTDLYPVLNIDFLIRLLGGLDEKAYEELVEPMFNQPGGYAVPRLIEQLAEQARAILSEQDWVETSQNDRIAESLICFFEIRGRGADRPALNVFREFSGARPDAAVGLLAKHIRDRHAGIVADVWNMIASLVKRVVIPEEVITEGIALVLELHKTGMAESHLARAVQSTLTTVLRQRRKGSEG